MDENRKERYKTVVHEAHKEIIHQFGRMAEAQRACFDAGWQDPTLEVAIRFYGDAIEKASGQLFPTPDAEQQA